MNFVKGIVQKLIDVDDVGIEESLLPEEKCRCCGRELLGIWSQIKRICANCERTRYGDKRLSCKWVLGEHCDLRYDDPDFNKGHGQRFMNAMDRAIARGDFR